MKRVLHLLHPGDVTLASLVIRQAVEAGGEVTVALLQGAVPGPLPDGTRTRRVPDDLSWEALLEEVFAADHVITW